MIRFLLAALLLLVPVVTRAQSLVASGQITWGLHQAAYEVTAH